MSSEPATAEALPCDATPAIPESVPPQEQAAPPVPGPPALSRWRAAFNFMRATVPRQIAAAALVFGALATTGHIIGGFIGWWHLYELAFLKGKPQAAAPAGKAPRLSIVVLPLAADKDAADAGALADALADALTTDITLHMGRLSGSVVISRDTALSYKGKNVDPREIARDLKVRYLVRGRVQRAADKVQLDLELVDGESGARKWADQFTMERANIASALVDVTRVVSRNLGVEMYRADGQRAAALKPEQVEADDLAMAGWSMWYRGLSRENTLQAWRLFDAAVARDPDSLRGWAGLSITSGTAASSGWADREAAQQRQREAVRNLERIDPNDQFTYMARSGTYWSAQDFEGLLQLSRAQIERFPSNPHGYFQQAGALLMLGRFDECIEPSATAIRLGPRDSQQPYYRSFLATCHFMAGRYASAAEEARLAVQSNTGLAGPQLLLAASLARSGRLAEAQVVVQQNSKHERFRAQTWERVLLGNEPRLAEGRERLFATLKELGVP